MGKAKYKFVPNEVRDLIIDECAKAVPTNWVDPLLTGPKAVKIPSDCRDVEYLLRSIQDRILALKSDSSSAA